MLRSKKQADPLQKALKSISKQIEGLRKDLFSVAESLHLHLDFMMEEIHKEFETLTAEVVKLEGLVREGNELVVYALNRDEFTEREGFEKTAKKNRRNSKKRRGKSSKGAVVKYLETCEEFEDDLFSASENSIITGSALAEKPHSALYSMLRDLNTNNPDVLSQYWGLLITLVQNKVFEKKLPLANDNEINPGFFDNALLAYIEYRNAVDDLNTDVTQHDEFVTAYDLANWNLSIISWLQSEGSLGLYDKLLVEMGKCAKEIEEAVKKEFREHSTTVSKAIEGTFKKVTEKPLPPVNLLHDHDTFCKVLAELEAFRLPKAPKYIQGGKKAISGDSYLEQVRAGVRKSATAAPIIPVDSTLLNAYLKKHPIPTEYLLAERLGLGTFSVTAHENYELIPTRALLGTRYNKIIGDRNKECYYGTNDDDGLHQNGLALSFHIKESDITTPIVIPLTATKKETVKKELREKEFTHFLQLRGYGNQAPRKQFLIDNTTPADSATAFLSELRLLLLARLNKERQIAVRIAGKKLENNSHLKSLLFYQQLLISLLQVAGFDGDVLFSADEFIGLSEYSDGNIIGEELLLCSSRLSEIKPKKKKTGEPGKPEESEESNKSILIRPDINLPQENDYTRMLSTIRSAMETSTFAASPIETTLRQSLARIRYFIDPSKITESTTKERWDKLIEAADTLTPPPATVGTSSAGSSSGALQLPSPQPPTAQASPTHRSASPGSSPRSPRGSSAFFQKPRELTETKELTATSELTEDEMERAVQQCRLFAKSAAHLLKGFGVNATKPSTEETETLEQGGSP